MPLPPAVAGPPQRASGTTWPALRFPDLTILITVPLPLVDSRAFRAIWARVSKIAMRRTLFKHWRTRIPRHFKQNARQKYRHAKRTRPYKRIKRRTHGSITDLVASGKTRRQFKAFLPRIQLGGTVGTVIRGRIIYKFPFPVAGHGKAKRATPEQMAKEIGLILPAELQDIAEDYRDFFLEELQIELSRAPKLRKQYTTAAAGGQRI